MSCPHRSMAYYRELVAVCVKALSNFDPSTGGVEDYLERFLNSTDCEVCSGDSLYGLGPTVLSELTVLSLQVLEREREQVFLREVVAGYVQHRQFIKVHTAITSYNTADSERYIFPLHHTYVNT